MNHVIFQKGRIFRSIFLITCTFISASLFAQKEVGKPKLIDPANMDPTIKPGNDFMGYAGGVWQKNNPVPAKETRWGAFNMLRDFNVKAVRVILEEASADKNAAPGSVKKRVGDFYAAGMDSLAVEKAGFTPVIPDYKRAGAVQNPQQVLDEIIFERTNGVANPLFGFFVAQDRKHPQVMAVQIS